MPTRLPSPDRLYRFERAPWCHPWVWLFMGAVILASDYLSGFWLQFPVFFILPVLLVAWHRKLRWAIAYAVIICGIRFSFQFIWVEAWSPLTNAANASLRCGVLVLLAALTSRIARLTRELRQRINTLEGILPTCAHCKCIRNEKGEWHAIETYIQQHSKAKFSHGICPECIKKYWGHLFPDGEKP